MPTMNVSLTEEMSNFVSGEIESGNYATASELVRDALRAMKRDRETEAEKLALLRRELAAGIREADRGEFSGRTVMEIAQSVIDED